MDHDSMDQILRLSLEDGLDAATTAARVKKNQAKVESVIARYESSLHKRETLEVCVVR